MDDVNAVLHMEGCLEMERDDIRAAGSKLLQIPLRLPDHQMRVEHLVRGLPDGLQDRHAKGNLRHKVPVHHVEVKIGCAGLFRLFDVVCKVQKICREY